MTVLKSMMQGVAFFETLPCLSFCVPIAFVLLHSALFALSPFCVFAQSVLRYCAKCIKNVNNAIMIFALLWLAQLHFFAFGFLR